ncbi:MAG: Uncharacterized protein XD92_0065 [Proteiniphilum acetatigenes]|uniref:Anti-bacteriophage protein A/HamA C-terminal domain-containing protein n=1 Tax=Proteiniphilum acetatigenes TaxID=294710 RepID=A0A101HKZ7_9BACT|nr:MAG: Uncharacterized protein XD92_0065 [Proteiniphilum acetatigenes]HCC85998.1 hypothetical protein [Porphyromonadaceae bacterium]
MRVEYQFCESDKRGYQGVSLDEQECHAHLKGPVKDCLLDRQERENTLEHLKALTEETGFDANEDLLADIKALEDENVEVQNFRIGEAYAELILEKEFSCRFYWNELRDARNPKGNKTGADLVGFIEEDGLVLFLFGEVKTSSETTKRPPQVMTGAAGIEVQLRNMYNNRSKRLILLSYLKSKMRLFPADHPFKLDYESGIKAYYSKAEKYKLFGVLIRDVEPDERDLSPSYHRLKTQILEPVGLNLLALYIPIQKKNWLPIINSVTE